MNKQFDITIVGGNLVGASAALALSQAGWKVALVDGNRPLHPGDGWDSRIYAISPANQLWLEQLGAWSNLDLDRVAAVSSMQIFGDAGAALEFDAYRTHRNELATIVESQRLHSAIWQALDGWPGTEIFAPSKALAVQVSATSAELQLDNGCQLCSRLLIAADGAQSWVRKSMGIEQRLHDYHQCGVVANFETATPPRGMARQWFRDDGILAFLPLPGNRMSMVWSTSQHHAEELLKAAPASLCEEVAEAGQQSLGALTLITPPAAFPLRLTQAEEVARPRAVLIGDAAHTVHPLAGQGVNLGFGDVIELTKVLSGTPDPGDAARLRRFARARAMPVGAMATTTHGLARLFGIDDPVLRTIRNIGMGCVEQLPIVKTWLVQRAAT